MSLTYSRTHFKGYKSRDLNKTNINKGMEKDSLYIISTFLDARQQYESNNMTCFRYSMRNNMYVLILYYSQNISTSDIVQQQGLL